MKTLKWITVMAAMGAICGCMTRPTAESGKSPSLPVYEIVKSGASATEVAALADQLKIPVKSLVASGGLVTFVDPGKFLATPAAQVTESELTQRLRAATRNKDVSRPIGLGAIDTSSLNSWRVFDPRQASDTFGRALSASGLEPQFGIPAIGHAQLTLYSKDASGWNSTRQDLDTEVSYTFAEPGGHPLVGPGAQVQVAFDAAGGVSRLHYASRRLKAGPSVRVITEAEARNRISRLEPDGVGIVMRVVYWSPPLQLELARREEWSPSVIIPWYAYYSTRQMTSTSNGAVSVVNSKVRMIPATDDERFVPAVQLSATVTGSRVSAHASVSGGRPPYRFIWGGSNPEASDHPGDSTEYTATLRVSEELESDPIFRLERDEAVAVTVIDSNGVAVRARQTVRVRASPVHPRHEDKKKQGATPLYGIESPGSPLKWMEDQVGWLQGMSTPTAGGGALSFCWMGDDAWPGDLIEPNPPGKLVATPWVYGDADYSNWGINEADIDLDNADGAADWKAVMQPGAPLAEYPTASFQSLNSSATVVINQGGFGTPASFYVNYAGSWGPIPSNDTLFWLLMDNCDMLDAADGSGANVADRWSGAFNGLHIMTGFASLDTPDGYGDFERDLATDMLGVAFILGLPFPVPPQTIVQSWFDSAEGNGIGTAAAMGPALFVKKGQPYSLADLDDFYWGKGTVGPTIVPSHYTGSEIGWWYLTTTTPVNVVFP
ncbi:MAG: DUF6345 domain-containing protein [Opitutaceae bacterium]|jgi:hypothetical protein